MEVALTTTNNIALTALIDRAALALNGARSAAEILEAGEMASFAYDMAKKTARLNKAKRAADDLITTAYRVQADALDIEAGAKRRLADEYDAAQERGEVASVADGRRSSKAEDLKPTAENIGITHKQIHEARTIRDAEAKEPGIVRRVLDEALEAGEEPTRAKVNKAVKVRRARGARFEVPQESQHDRDLQMLLGVWGAACESAREEFLKTVER